MKRIINGIVRRLKLIKVRIITNYYRIKYKNQLKIGKNVFFKVGFIINIAKDGYLEIGDNNFFNNYCSINCRNRIVIGDGNLFGENVKFYDHDHIFNIENEELGSTFSLGEISVGDNNWFGTNIVVLRNTFLKNNNVIGASTVLKGNFTSKEIITSNRELKTEKIKYKK